MTKDLFTRLDAARASLRSCLEELDGGAPNDSGVGRGFEVMGQAFAELGDLESLWDQVNAKDEERLQDSLEELMRLNAVLTKVVQRDEERLRGQIAHARIGRQNIAAQKIDGEIGGTCDMSC
ncbi:MAG: hypothetical protein ACI8QC_000828 [Planctomycetota bacterium]|jgi:hypothetical protein